jgi:hypothetical protein
MVKTEVANIIKAYRVFKSKKFPSGSKVQLLNEATGKWGYIVTVEKYIFSLNSDRRGVYIRYSDGGKEKISILKWFSWRKRPAVKKKVTSTQKASETT